jgi:hypothetical protein
MRTVIVCLLAGLLAGCATANAPPTHSASVPFVRLGNIYSWKAEGTNSILIKSVNGRYYRGSFFSPCVNLPWAEAVGFDTDVRDELDKYEGITVRGESCRFRTFSEISIPKPAPL